MEASIKIGNRIIKESGRPYYIADIAANHDGDIRRAYKLIELAKESGADAAKFQNFKANLIVSKYGFEALGRQMSHQASWKKSVFEVYQDASLVDEWSVLLWNKCREVGIEYMTSPYDFDAVDWADKYVNAFKIGSGDITWTAILEHIAAKNKPILLATGASELEDVDRAVSIVRKSGAGYGLMQCNTNYTASAENIKYLNLNVLRLFRERYPDAVLGLSDHTMGHVAVLGAIALGARVIEKHFTDDNSRSGPDHKFSMTPDSWTQMVVQGNELFEALGSGEKKIEENERESVVIQRRALVAAKDLKEGEIICAADFFPLRPIPSEGIPPYELENIVGKQLTRDIERGHYLHRDDYR